MDILKRVEDDSDVKDLLIDDILVQLPSDLIENRDNYLHFFSIETWSNLVPEDLKHHLLQYLPNFENDDSREKEKTISMLFGGENFHFGNPLEKFRDRVRQGAYNPESCEIKELVLKAKKRDYKHRIERLQFATAQKCLNSRKKHLEALTGNIVTVPKIERKRGVKVSFTKERIAKRYCEEIERIRREVGGGEYSSDEEEQSVNDNNQQPPAGHWQKEIANNRDSNKDECMRALTQEIHNCFFALLRDLFLQRSDSSLTTDQLKHGVEMWQQSPIAALNSWYNQASENCDWKDLTKSAVTFLSGRGNSKDYLGFTPLLGWNETKGKNTHLILF